MVTAAELVGIPSEVVPRHVDEVRSFLGEVPLRMTPGAERVRGLVLIPRRIELALALRGSVGGIRRLRTTVV